MINLNPKKGFVVLATVLLVSAVGLLVGSGVLLRSLSTSNTSLYQEKSLAALNTVSACAEYAAKNLSTTTGGLLGWSYTGGESLPVNGNSCYIYTVTNNGSAKVIKASSTVSGFTRKIQVEIATTTPQMFINFWKVVPDFI